MINNGSLFRLFTGMRQVGSPTSRQANVAYKTKIRLGLALVLAFIFLHPGSGLYAQQAEDLSVKKSKHFIIYYSEVSSGYASRVARQAEHYYKSVINYLGFNRFDFWTWDNRCKIYLYPNQESYQEATDAEHWSTGRVHVGKKEISTYAQREQFLDYILPHEMGHIIFREAVGFDKDLPLWIDEGIATLQEKDRDKYLLTARIFVREKNFISLEDLSNIRSYTQISPLVFYSESASIMEFLLERFSRREFVAFCHRLRDGEEWEDALLRTYKFENLQQLEDAWINGI